MNNYKIMKYKIENPKRTIGFLIGILLIIGGSIWGIMAIVKHQKDKKNPENQPQVYEALVAITDQKAGDPVEDARASLKKGDVIAYFPAGHPWSETERISYLIVKIKLKSDEAKNLTQAQTKEVKRDIKAGDGSNGPAPKDMGPQMETVRARAYRIKMEKLNFDVQKFWENHEQPYPDKIFDSGMIEKKKEIK
jgi:hypothetical protein